MIQTTTINGTKLLHTKYFNTKIPNLWYIGIDDVGWANMIYAKSEHVIIQDRISYSNTIIGQSVRALTSAAR